MDELQGRFGCHDVYSLQTVNFIGFSSMFNHGYLGSTVNGMRLRFKRRRPSMGVEGKKKSKKKVGGACSVGIKNIAPA